MMTTFTPWAFPETENLVVVVGAGGIGARVLPTLVKMLPQGRSQVTVVDPDVVERPDGFAVHKRILHKLKVKS